METPYFDQSPYEVLRRLYSKHDSGVLHQRTCPKCKRTLVNLYRRGQDDLRCNQCWKKFDEHLKYLIDATGGQPQPIIGIDLASTPDISVETQIKPTL